MHTLSWLKQHGFSGIEIEYDSLLLIFALQSSAPDSSPFGGIVLDLKTLLWVLFLASSHLCSNQRTRSLTALRE